MVELPPPSPLSLAQALLEKARLGPKDSARHDPASIPLMGQLVPPLPSLPPPPPPPPPSPPRSPLLTGSRISRPPKPRFAVFFGTPTLSQLSSSPPLSPPPPSPSFPPPFPPPPLPPPPPRSLPPYLPPLLPMNHDSNPPPSDTPSPPHSHFARSLQGTEKVGFHCIARLVFNRSILRPSPSARNRSNEILRASQIR